MNVKPLFENPNDINIKDYLKAIGVNEPNEYLLPPSDSEESPYLYDNIEDMVKVFNKPWSHYWVLQDCDADGVLSAAIFCVYLKHLGVPQDDITIIQHDDKRHGLNDDIVDKIGSNGLLVIPDASPEEEKYVLKLRERNIEIICLDHHLNKPINEVVTINNQHSPNVENKALSGTGVTYKFIEWCCHKTNDDFYTRLADMVATANIADICDMRTLENRWFNAYGLRKIYNPFLKELCSVYIGENPITPTSLAWSVIPKINAVCRSDDGELKSAMFDCFACRSTNYEDVIPNMTATHRKSSAITKELMNDITIQEYDKLIVGYATKSPYTGLIANKLQDKYNKPAFVVYSTEANGLCGSCRSPINFINVCNDSNLFNFANGHEQAFGISIDKNKIEAFGEYLNRPDVVIPPLSVTSVLSPNIPSALFSMFEPYSDLWSNQVEEPTFLIRGLKLNGRNINVIGKSGSTIKFSICNIDYIKFFVSTEQKTQWHIGENIDMDVEILGKLKMNYYGGKATPQVVIEKMECNTKKKEITFEDIFG